MDFTIAFPNGNVERYHGTFEVTHSGVLRVHTNEKDLWFSPAGWWFLDKL